MAAGHEGPARMNDLESGRWSRMISNAEPASKTRMLRTPRALIRQTQALRK